MVKFLTDCIYGLALGIGIWLAKAVLEFLGQLIQRAG